MREGKLELTINSEEETQRLAKIISSCLHKGLVITLDGDLGAGKTTFTRELIAMTGNRQLVASPTFTILNVYEGNPLFYHFDFYRLETPADIENIGGSDYLPAADGITLVEWAAKIPEVLPEELLKIEIDYLGESSRKFIISNTSNKIDLERIRQAWQS